MAFQTKTRGETSVSLPNITQQISLTYLYLALKSQTFDDLKKAGFKSVRIPVTWTHHMVSDAPDYKVNATFLERVETVVDLATARGFYTILVCPLHLPLWNNLLMCIIEYTPRFMVGVLKLLY